MRPSARRSTASSSSSTTPPARAGSSSSPRCSATPSPSPTPAWRRGSSTALPVRVRQAAADIVEGRVVTSFTRELLEVRRLHRAELPAVHDGRLVGAVGDGAAAGAAASTPTSPTHDQDARRLRRRRHLHRRRSAIPSAESDQRRQHAKTKLGEVQPVRLDNDGTCDGFTNLAVELPSKVLGTFDPLQVVGKTATIVGMLQNHSGQNPYLDANGNMIACSDANRPCAKGSLRRRVLLQGRVQLLDDRCRAARRTSPSQPKSSGNRFKILQGDNQCAAF